MKKYISKSAIVAEIERVRMNYGCIFNEYDAGFSEGRCSAFDEVLSLLDTLEVKEVDLEKELKKKIGNVGECDRRLAEYFFELGLKAQKGE